MNEEQVSDKIINRIRKMLRLANDAGATEGERDNALRMAHATLAKYNLDVSQVEVDTGKKDDEPRDHIYEDFLGKPWALQISMAIAQLYFCKYYYQTIRGQSGQQAKARHFFIGRRANVVVAREMSMFVVASVNAEAQRYARNTGGRYPQYRAFAQAAAQRIRIRCHELMNASVGERERTPGTALVLANVYKLEHDANEEFFKTNANVKLKPSKSMTIATDAAARHAGDAYGASVSLHRQLGE